MVCLRLFKLVLTGLLIVLSSPVFAGGRDSETLAKGWQFHLGEAQGAEAVAYDETGWQEVVTPHTWNRIGGTPERTKDYNPTRGAAWYRLHFKGPLLTQSQKVWLEFDGASINTEVWLNGVRLGEHRGAFGRFRFDASSAFKPGQDNLLAVRSDNSKPGVPGSPTADIVPISGDFFMFGGLYRPVSLIITHAVHIDMLDFGGPGVYARTTSLDSSGAAILVRSRLKNDAKTFANVTVTTQIRNAKGVVVASIDQAQSLKPEELLEPETQLTIAKPRLWDGQKDPYLYQVAVKVTDNSGQVLDEVVQPLGVRTFRIDPDKGFFLNGKPLALHGVSRHQDRPVSGWVITGAQQKEDMDMILELGANTLRLAHYQHDQSIYDLADQNGLVVWAEIPIVNRTAPPGQDYPTDALIDNAQDQLRELINQNYNHPSVIVWSIGNEVNNAAKKNDGSSHSGPLLTRLNSLAHALDPSRPTTLADCCETEIAPFLAPPNPRVDNVTGITDTIAYNRYDGWYYTDRNYLGPLMDRLHQLHPSVPIAVGEFGAGGSLSQHTDNPEGGNIYNNGHFHPEEYQSLMHEIWWKQLKVRPFLWATWIWNMFDFASDERYEGDMVDTNDKGLVSYDRRTKKDIFYFYQANWSGKPVVHLTGVRYVRRAYPVTSVKVYSNADQVSLKVGTRDLGIAKCPDHICIWPRVPLNPGENRLTATAVIGGKTINDSLTWTYGGQANSYHIRAGSIAGHEVLNGSQYGSDDFFKGGVAHNRVPQPSAKLIFPTAELVAGATDQTLFETYREGRFSYQLPVAPGRYEVRLRFLEPDAKVIAGERVFSVTANGQPLLTNLDLVAISAGSLRAVEKTFIFRVSGTTGLKLAFTPSKGEAVVSTIDVIPIR